MTLTRRTRLVRGVCLWAGLVAFLWLEPGLCFASAQQVSMRGQGQMQVPAGRGLAYERGGPDQHVTHPNPTVRLMHLAGIGSAVTMPLIAPISPILGLQSLGHVAQAAGDATQGTGSTSATPVYKKTWFIAAAVGVVAVAAILFASGGGADEPSREPEGLPGFPPPPSGLQFIAGRRSVQ
jgi:hypothetical protein